MSKVTREEIEQLKKSWAGDPCWDIEDSYGFEAHRVELLKFSNEKKAVWEKHRKTRLFEFAESCGIVLHDHQHECGNPYLHTTIDGVRLAEKLMRMQERLDRIEEDSDREEP